MNKIKEYLIVLTTTQKIFLLSIVLNSILSIDGYTIEFAFLAVDYPNLEVTQILLIISILGFFLFSNKKRGET